MKKKSVHKATTNSVHMWEKVVQFVKHLIEKGYPSKVIKSVIKIIEFVLLLAKLFQKIRDFLNFI